MAQLFLQTKPAAVARVNASDDYIAASGRRLR